MSSPDTPPLPPMRRHDERQPRPCFFFAAAAAADVFTPRLRQRADAKMPF